MASESRKSNARNRSSVSKRPVSGAVARAVAPKASKQVAGGIGNEGYRAALGLRKLYPVLKNAFAEEHNLIRIIDESGENYLYPHSYFVRFEPPVALQQKLR